METLLMLGVTVFAFAAAAAMLVLAFAVIHDIWKDR